MKNQIKYTDEFIRAVKFCLAKGFYLGTGNPNAKILIIGKEAAIDMQKNNVQYNSEIVQNASDWLTNINDHTQQESLENWNGVSHNPLYPYKGQKNTVISFNKDGKVKRGLGGTSRTWYYYQRLLDGTLNEGRQSKAINFHEYSFTTELNQICGSYSHKIPRIERMNSIKAREELLQHEFFQRFPIVIVAVGHYIRDFQIDLQRLYGLRFNDETLDIDGKNWLHIHRELDGGQKRILIHTNQLSMINNDLIVKLSAICKDFLS